MFGAGTVREVGGIAGGAGQARAAGRRKVPAPANRAVTEPLAAAGVRWTAFSVDGEPTVDVARAGAAAARAAGCDLVIGFGGGSALDAAKAIAALAANGGDPLDYLEVVGRGQPLTRPSLPLHRDPDHRGHRLRGDARTRCSRRPNTASRRACAAR